MAPPVSMRCADPIKAGRGAQRPACLALGMVRGSGHALSVSSQPSFITSPYTFRGGRVALDVAQALVFLHDALGLVHLDVKSPVGV
jgi:hypothetical protein